MAVVFLLPAVHRADVVVRTSSSSATTQSTIDQFLADLGGVNNGSATGPFASGFRSINWDGVSAGASAPNNLAPNAFANRGAIFSTPGTGFQVSAGSASGTAVRFGNIDPSYSSTFQTFSPEKLFTPLGANTMDVSFVIPGGSTTAGVRGFGAVFADVDKPGPTMIDTFDLNGDLLFSLSVPASTNGLSFVGLSFDAGEQIGRVRLTLGDNPLGTGIPDGPEDLVVLDDFFFGEPQLVPEPGTMALFAFGVLVLGGWLRRCRR
jgi:hypothetical protein